MRKQNTNCIDRYFDRSIDRSIDLSIYCYSIYRFIYLTVYLSIYKHILKTSFQIKEHHLSATRYKMRYVKETYKLRRVLHCSTQTYTYETIWSSTKSRKIELQSYLMYIKDYLKKHKSYAEYRCKLHFLTTTFRLLQHLAKRISLK